MRKLDYGALLQRLRAVAGDRLEVMGEFDSNGRRYQLTMLQFGSGPIAVMIAAGIHGDEPAGVEAAIRFTQRALTDRRLLDRFRFVVFPCNNPTGWELGTRENAAGVDLNREFASRHPQAEAAIIMRALQGHCFDLVFEMHEDVDSVGFYLYELVNDRNAHWGERIVETIERLGVPINRTRRIEGMSARGGVIRRKTLRFRKTRLPQAVYTYRTCGGHVITLETPASLLDIGARANAQLAALDTALQLLGD